MSDFLVNVACGFGAIVLVCVSTVVILLTIEAIRDHCVEPHGPSFREGVDHARNLLINDSWWFGESIETQELLRDLGRGVNVSDAREKWRMARESTEVAQ